MNLAKIITLIIISFFTLNSCGGFKYSPARENPVKGQDRARKNIEEGRGVSLGNAMKRGGTNYEFSSSNPMWRASLETLDFLPLSVVDYSGGIIVTDWYSDGSNNNNSIKISLRFLSNEVRSDSLKVTVHKKTCSTALECKISVLEKNKIVSELHSTIIRKAAVLKNEKKK